MKVGFIGAGNLGLAIIKGIIASGLVPAANIIAYDPVRARLEEQSRENGFRAATGNDQVVRESEIVFLAVRPPQIEPVLQSLAGLINERQTVLVSIATGISLEVMARALNNPKAAIVRTLPNLGVEIKEGLVAMCHSDGVEAGRLREVESLLAPLGRVVPLPQTMLTTFSSLAACSYAFIFMFIEALAKGGVKEGLTKPQALEIAAQAVAGAAKLVLETGQHPYALIDNVCSPGGTTICGVKALEDGAFTATVMNAVAAASARDLEIIGGK